jgi:hypothetical protein
MQTTIKDAIKKNTFLQRCWDNTSATGKTGEAQYCIYCGQEKMEFLNPLAEEYIQNQSHIELVECECEQRFKMLGEFLDINYEWLNYPQTVPVIIPDYGNGENKDERRMAQKKFVVMAKIEFDEMIERREKNKLENKNIL